MPIIGGRQIGVRGLGFQGAGKPNQVTGLTATDFGTSRAYNNGRIDLSWTEPANNGAPITGYRVERSTDNISYSAISVNTGTTSTTYTDTGLNSNQIYYYKVAAINAVDTGPLSTAANATATTVPQAPTIGTVSRTNNTTASLAFTAGFNGGKTITSYTVSSNPSISLGTSGTSSPLTVTGTYVQGTSYTFSMTATNANGTSQASGNSNSVTMFPFPSVTGGTLYSDATYYYRKFTSSQNLVVSNGSVSTEYLVISGGGTGGLGGGGAGGFLTGTSSLSSNTYPIVVGGSATNSSFNGISPTRGGSCG